MEARAKESSAPLFSVIVPIYNTELYLRRCLDSILGQTYQDFELILVDNGSTDGCPALCDGYAQQDSRVRVVHKQHGAPTSARNAGLAIARGIYICYVDSDDRVERTYMETVARYAEEFSRPDMILFGAMVEFSTHSERMAVFTAADGYYSRERLEREILPYMIMDRRLPKLRGTVLQVPWNKVFKRELLQEHHCRDERICQAEDLSFVYECIYFADSAYFSQEVLYHYNCANPSSLTGKYCENLLEQYQWVDSYVKERLSGRDPELDAQISLLSGFFLISAVLNEVKYGANVWAAATQIRKKIAKSRMLKECPLREVPFRPRVHLLLLKLQCCHLLWLETKLLLLRGELTRKRQAKRYIAESTP